MTSKEQESDFDDPLIFRHAFHLQKQEQQEHEPKGEELTKKEQEVTQKEQEPKGEELTQ